MTLIANAQPQGWWGHGSRNKWQRSLPGAFHMHADDDDLYTPDAFVHIRAAITTLEPRLYIFRLIRKWDGVINLVPPMRITHGSQVTPGLISTQCGIYRALPELMCDWAYIYGGDGIFYGQLIENFGVENVTFVRKVIYHMSQTENYLPSIPALLAEANMTDQHG